MRARQTLLAALAVAAGCGGDAPGAPSTASPAAASLSGRWVLTIVPSAGCTLPAPPPDVRGLLAGGLGGEMTQSGEQLTLEFVGAAIAPQGTAGTVRDGMVTLDVLVGRTDVCAGLVVQGRAAGALAGSEVAGAFAGTIDVRGCEGPPRDATCAAADHTFRLQRRQ